MIDFFDGAYAFLSNFYLCDIKFEGLTYKNTESAFQACKVKNIEERKRFQNLSPSLAKLNGRRVSLREDWEFVKDDYMYRIVKAKFVQNPNLKKLLLNTKQEYLIEGNTWHDNYWGDCCCSKCKNKKGENQLGKILMEVREELMNE